MRNSDYRGKGKLLKDSPGFRLKLLRRQLEKTQSQFAEELGISGSTLSRYEKNLRAPEVYFFKLLNMKTGVDLNWLLAGVGTMFPLFSEAWEHKEGILKQIFNHSTQLAELIEMFNRFAPPKKEESQE